MKDKDLGLKEPVVQTTQADRQRLDWKLMNHNALNVSEARDREWNTRHSEAIEHAKRHNFTPEPWATLYANTWIGSIEDFEKAVREA